MNLKALRRPHELGRATTQVTIDAGRSHRRLAVAHAAPRRPRLVGRWTVTGEGCLEFTWELEPERPAFRLIIRKRGSHV
jgi:hypothetical protein